jgi:hypothetical protein
MLNAALVAPTGTSFVNLLTRGTIAIDTAIALTPDWGAMLMAKAKLPDDIVCIAVKMPTTAIPLIRPAHAPFWVVFLLYSPQMHGPIKQPDTTPHEKDIRFTINEIFASAKR